MKNWIAKKEIKIVKRIVAFNETTQKCQTHDFYHQAILISNYKEVNIKKEIKIIHSTNQNKQFCKGVKVEIWLENWRPKNSSIGNWINLKVGMSLSQAYSYILCKLQLQPIKTAEVAFFLLKTYSMNFFFDIYR